MSLLTRKPRPQYRRKGNGQFDGSQAREAGKRGVELASAAPVPFQPASNEAGWVEPTAPRTPAAYQTGEMIAELEAAVAPAVSFADRFRRLAARRRIEATFGPVDWAA